jgi:hypothetical protein
MESLEASSSGPETSLSFESVVLAEVSFPEGSGVGGS